MYRHRLPTNNRGIAQPGSAAVLGTAGRWFESSCPDHIFESCSGIHVSLFTPQQLYNWLAYVVAGNRHGSGRVQIDLTGTAMACVNYAALRDFILGRSATKSGEHFPTRILSARSDLPANCVDGFFDGGDAFLHEDRLCARTSRVYRAFCFDAGVIPRFRRTNK